jgi:cell division protein FtsL
MQRMLNCFLLLATFTATVALYAITYDTRRLEAKVQAQERALERAERDVNVLRAERAHLARPERLEPLARELGLAPIESGQYLRLAPLPQADSPADPSLQGAAASTPAR